MLRHHGTPSPHRRPSYKPVVERLEARHLLDTSYYNLLAGDFWQDWSDTSLISGNNDWSRVPGVLGYRGDELVASTGVDPQTVTDFAGPGGPVVNVQANQTDPDNLSPGGVAEFEIANPVVALKGSGTARAPFLLFQVNTTGVQNVAISYNLRDIDGSSANALSQVALQYRVGTTGPFINLPDGYVPDATTGPYQAYLVTPVGVTLPPDAANQPQVQIRVITTDAVSYDEWVGVDDVSITGDRTAVAADSLRIVTYNIASSMINPRAGLAGLSTILPAIGNESVGGGSRPLDVLALQEVYNQATTTQYVVDLLNNVYGTGTYTRGSVNGRTTGAGTQGLVYNTRTVQLLDEVAVGATDSTGAARQTLRYLLRPVGTSGGADFYLYNSHYKALSDTTSQGRRLVEAAAIRADADALGPGVQVLYVGDYNMYTSNEAGYQQLLAAGNGQAFDPVNRPGSWHHNRNFVDVFTQAPSRNPPPGLTGGGLDDRFDFELMTGALFDGSGLDYRPGSYHPFGVNGSLPVGASVNDPGNTALPDLPNRIDVLNLLATVTDHLPVVADYAIMAGSGPGPAPSGNGSRPLAPEVVESLLGWANRPTAAGSGNGANSAVPVLSRPVRDGFQPGPETLPAGTLVAVRGPGSAEGGIHRIGGRDHQDRVSLGDSQGLFLLEEGVADC